MRIEKGKFTVVVFSNKYGFYTRLKNKDDSLFITVYNHDKDNEFKNGDIIEVISGFFGCYVGVEKVNPTFNVTSFKTVGNVLEKKKNGKKAG